jgi:hypothetical protein
MRIGVLVLAIAACQPMYGGKAQKLKDPPLVDRGDTKTEGPPPKPYIDKCTTNMHVPSPPKGAPRDPVAAATYTQQAEASYAKVETADTTDKKRDLVLAAINQYQGALAKDPYDATATLELARLYDRTLRKGCALAMLRRLEALAGHKTFEAAANSAKKQVHDNADWFADYRDEALREIP